jgi:hypothetical protein
VTWRGGRGRKVEEDGVGVYSTIDILLGDRVIFSTIIS